MTWFRLSYVDNTEERITVDKEFNDTPTVTAKEWAFDYLYTIADKRTGDATLEEIKP